MKLRFPILALVFLSVLSGCTKQKKPSVTLLNDRFIIGNTDISPGGVLMFKWIAEKGKSDLASFTILMNGTDLQFYGFPKTTIPADIYFDSIPPMEGPVTKGDYVFSFIATDVDGNIGEESLVVTVE
ncbi:hypothetical protein ACFLTU_04975 [Bacteroidota bacterium]